MSRFPFFCRLCLLFVVFALVLVCFSSTFSVNAIDLTESNSLELLSWQTLLNFDQFSVGERLTRSRDYYSYPLPSKETPIPDLPCKEEGFSGSIAPLFQTTKAGTTLTFPLKGQAKPLAEGISFFLDTKGSTLSLWAGIRAGQGKILYSHHQNSEAVLFLLPEEGWEEGFRPAQLDQEGLLTLKNFRGFVYLPFASLRSPLGDSFPKQETLSSLVLFLSGKDGTTFLLDQIGSLGEEQQGEKFASLLSGKPPAPFPSNPLPSQTEVPAEEPLKGISKEEQKNISWDPLFLAFGCCLVGVVGAGLVFLTEGLSFSPHRRTK